MQKGKNLTNSKNKEALSPKKQMITNPIDKAGLVAKINVLGSGISNVKVSPQTHIHNEKSFGVVDYANFIKETNDIIKNYSDLNGAIAAFHHGFVNRFNVIYTGLGIINEESNSVDVKFLDKNSNVYTFKVFKNDKDNEIIKAIDSNEVTLLKNSQFLKLPSLFDAPSVIIPIKIQGRNIFMFLAPLSKK